MRPSELHELLAPLVPSTPEGADHLLDLREALMSDGHPGRCVRCFFGLLGDLGQPCALRPLRHWLERHLEVEVTAKGEEIDSLPVSLAEADTLEDFCYRAMDTMRHDRPFKAKQIEMRLRFRSMAADRVAGG